MEVLYVCEGTLTNIIDGKQVIVRKGELLFLNQFTHHEILAAGRSDIAINFMVLPEFFDVAYSMAGNNNVLADFLVNVEAVSKADAKAIFAHDFLSKKEMKAYCENAGVKKIILLDPMYYGDPKALPDYIKASLDEYYPRVTAAGDCIMN